MEAEEGLAPSPGPVATSHEMAAVIGLGKKDLAASQLGYRVVRGVPFSEEQYAQQFE